jgi:hypothetical protein
MTRWKRDGLMKRDDAMQRDDATKRDGTQWLDEAR